MKPARAKGYQEFCVVCGKHPPEGFHPFCGCGGMVDVAYDLAGARLHESADSLDRFFDLLPLVSSQHLLPVEIEATPCVHATKLGDEVGLSRLYLKDESVLPTGTTKDRMAAVALSYLIEKGVRSFCTSSTGNSSTAFARLMPLAPDCRLYLFTAEAFMDRVQYTDGDQVVHLVLRDATFVDAFDAAKQYADRHGVVPERGFFNPGRREGLKLAYLEAAEQIPHPIDWYVQAVSSAMGVYGAYKGAKELPRAGTDLFAAAPPVRAAGVVQSHGPGVRGGLAGDPARAHRRTPDGNRLGHPQRQPDRRLPLRSRNRARERRTPGLRERDRDPRGPEHDRRTSKDCPRASPPQPPSREWSGWRARERFPRTT